MKKDVMEKKDVLEMRLRQRKIRKEMEVLDILISGRNKSFMPYTHTEEKEYSYDMTMKFVNQLMKYYEIENIPVKPEKEKLSKEMSEEAAKEKYEMDLDFYDHMNEKYEQAYRCYDAYLHVALFYLVSGYKEGWLKEDQDMIFEALLQLYNGIENENGGYDGKTYSLDEMIRFTDLEEKIKASELKSKYEVFQEYFDCSADNYIGFDDAGNDDLLRELDGNLYKIIQAMIDAFLFDHSMGICNNEETYFEVMGLMRFTKRKLLGLVKK